MIDYKNIVTTLFRGDIMLKLKLDKGFPYILWFFLLAWLRVFILMQIDYSILKMENNRQVLNELQIEYAQKTTEIASFDRMSSIDRMLEKQGSQLAVPTKPARRVK